MQNQHTLGGRMGIPSLLLTILQQVVFVRMSFVSNDIYVVRFRQCLHIADALCFSKLYGVKPSDAILFVAGIARGNKAIAIIAAAIHERPCVHTV